MKMNAGARLELLRSVTLTKPGAQHVSASARLKLWSSMPTAIAPFDHVEHHRRRAHRQLQRLTRTQHLRVETQDVLSVATCFRIYVRHLHHCEVGPALGERHERRACFGPRVSQHRVRFVVALETGCRYDPAVRIDDLAVVRLDRLANPLDRI